MNIENRDKFAVIYSITESVATLLVGEKENQMVVDLDALPEGAKEGDWFEVNDEGKFLPAPEMTKNRKRLVRSKLDMLRKR